MRIVRSLMMPVVALLANAAQAYDGPPSGEWRSYRLEFLGPTIENFGIYYFLRSATCFNGDAGDDYYCTETDYNDGCDSLSPCEDPFLRRVQFGAAVLQFAFYTPPSYSFCENDPPYGRRNIQCGEFWDSPDLYYSVTPDVDYVVTWTLGPGGIVPEPTAWALMVVGFGLIGQAVRWNAGPGASPRQGRMSL